MLLCSFITPRENGVVACRSFGFCDCDALLLHAHGTPAIPGLMQVLVDVRPKQIYEKSHPEGAKHAALFRKFDITKSSFTSILRATALALNGVEAVEPNPEFGEILYELQAGCMDPGGILLGLNLHACAPPQSRI